MRVVMAGGTGVIGQPLIPALVEAGHETIVLARSSRRAAIATAAGGKFVQVDALDRGSLVDAVTAARPDAVVSLLTAIPQQLSPKRIAAEFQLTNRLRTEGTRNLIEAAKVSGGAKLVSESITFAYAPSQRRVVAEDTPLWGDGPRQFQPVIAALKELERLTVEVGGVVLRFGHLYGPGTVFGRDGYMTCQVREGKVPIVVGGTGVFSFLHTQDAAKALCAAINHDQPGTFNIVDDDPAEVHTWLPAFAAILAAPPPKRVPAFVARLFVGAWGVAYMTKLRGASNGRARGILGWEPMYTSWRQGFEQEL